MRTANELTLYECQKNGDDVVKNLAARIVAYLNNTGSSREGEVELASPQTIEAYRTARSTARTAEKRVYELEQQLEAARRANGIMIEQVISEQDRAAALSAELDEERASHVVAIGILQTALDAANRKVEAMTNSPEIAARVIAIRGQLDDAARRSLNESGVIIDAGPVGPEDFGGSDYDVFDIESVRPRR